MAERLSNKPLLQLLTTYHTASNGGVASSASNSSASTPTPMESPPSPPPPPPPPISIGTVAATPASNTSVQISTSPASQRALSATAGRLVLTSQQSAALTHHLMMQQQQQQLDQQHVKLDHQRVLLEQQQRIQHQEFVYGRVQLQPSSGAQFYVASASHPAPHLLVHAEEDEDKDEDRTTAQQHQHYADDVRDELVISEPVALSPADHHEVVYQVCS